MAGPPLELILARSLVAHVAIPAFLADPSGRVLYFNEGAEKLIGRAMEESGDLSWQDVILLLDAHTPEGDPVKPDQLPISRAVGEGLPATITAVTGDGRRYCAVALPLKDLDGTVIGAMSLWYEEKP